MPNLNENDAHQLAARLFSGMLLPASTEEIRGRLLDGIVRVEYLDELIEHLMHDPELGYEFYKIAQDPKRSKGDAIAVCMERAASIWKMVLREATIEMG